MLLEADDLLRRLRIDRRDLLVPGVEIWNSDTEAVSATVEFQTSSLLLKVMGGGSPGSQTIDYGDEETLGLLCQAALDLGQGWVATPLADAGSPSSDLQILPSSDALGNKVVAWLYDESWLSILCSTSQSLLESVCQRKLEVSDLVEVYSGNGTQLLALRNYPLHEVTSIEIGGEEVDSGLYAAEDYTGLVWKLSGCWPRGRQNISVSYSAGYDRGGIYAGTPPDSLIDLLAEIAKDLYYSAGREPRVRSERLGMISRLYLSEGWPPQIEEKINLYRRVDPR
jgi:hypothetical protein